ncbi:unnamed protein product [Chironomus riparius]|uniref:trypsin n=1 Tax=Chironomus riparius TaxID=315576 RepID=A0A9N9RL07_9DIPT|nr:unnamed protein product [Chironomus riparius]
MNLKSIILTLILGLQLNFARSESGKIVGGEIMDITNVPYFVSLEHFTRRFICGGSIISNFWVLSAAQCKVDVEETDMRVRSGSSRRLSGGQVHKVLKAFIHPNYTDLENPSTEYNFLMLKLVNPIIFDDKRQAIVLAVNPSMYKQSGSALALGFGKTENPTQSSEILRGVVLELINDYCNDGSSILNKVCVKSPLKGVCAGDIGGPLESIQFGTLLGVVTHNDHLCGHAVYAEYFGSIFLVNKWIYQTMDNNQD